MRIFENKHTKVTLVFDREALLYDIKNPSYVEGDVMDDGNIHAKHQTQDIGEDGNIDRVNRMLEIAHAECARMLHPYTKVAIGDAEMVVSNLPKTPEDYRIEMIVPENFPATSIELLSEWIHEYMVCRAIGDWMSITNPGAEEKWLIKAETAKDKIKGAIRAAEDVKRRPMSPF